MCYKKKFSIASGGHHVNYFFEVDKKFRNNKQNMLKVQTSTHLPQKWNIGFIFVVVQILPIFSGQIW